MSDQILREAYVVDITVSYLSFRRNDCPDAGFSFQLDDNDEPLLPYPETVANYKACICGTNNTTPLGIERRTHTVRIPALLQCYCGEELELYHPMTNTCHKCGRDYNSSGSLLAPRSQWGCETGESASDILNYDYEGAPDVDY